MGGWIKVYRELLRKPIWKKSTPEQCKILMTILLMANHEEKQWEWQGEKFNVKRGQFITSIDNIVGECGSGISQKNVRTALAKFERLGFLANQSTKTGRLITIVNWDIYQNVEEDNKGEMAEKGQRTGKEVATNKNDKNDNNNIYTKIFNHWNSKAIVRHRALSKNIEASITKALKIYSKEQILQAIDRYAKVYYDKGFYYNHSWTLEKFLKQGNGISNYTDEGMMWINYKKTMDYLGEEEKIDLREKYIVT